MSCRNRTRTRRMRRPLFRRLDKKLIAGVCAGIAEHFCVPVHFIRLGFILGVLFNLPLFLIIYAVATIALPTAYGPQAAEATGFEVPPAPGQASGAAGYEDIRTQFDSMEHKIRKMEDYVTSKEFELRRKFENL